jgi:hypothetical protein
MNIKECLKASIGTIWVDSTEYSRVTAAILKAVGELNSEVNIDKQIKCVYVWKPTSSEVEKVFGDGDAKLRVGDFAAAIKIFSEKSMSVLMIYGVGKLINANPVTSFSLVDAATLYPAIGSTVIVVDSATIPESIVGVCSIVDFPLPTEEELTGIVTEFCNIQNIQIDRDSKSKVVESLKGLTGFQAEDAISLAYASKGLLDLSYLRSVKASAIKQSPALSYIGEAESMDSLGSFSEFKKWLKLRKRLFEPESLKYGNEYPKGVIIIGPPGVGKSLSAKVVSTFLDLPLVRMDVGALFGKYVGDTESALRLAQKVMDATAPSVIWIDEIEKALAGGFGGGGGETSSALTKKVVGSLLTWRQETKAPVFIVATCNDISALPSEMYRKGRFDKVWWVDLPTEEERKEIFRIHIHKRARDIEKFKIGVFAHHTEGFTGAEIEDLVKEAMIAAYCEDREVNDRDIAMQIKAAKPQFAGDGREAINRVRGQVAAFAESVSGIPLVAVSNVVKTGTRRIRNITAPLTGSN